MIANPARFRYLRSATALYESAFDLCSYVQFHNHCPRNRATVRKWLAAGQQGDWHITSSGWHSGSPFDLPVPVPSVRPVSDVYWFKAFSRWVDNAFDSLNV